MKCKNCGQTGHRWWENCPKPLSVHLANEMAAKGAGRGRKGQGKGKEAGAASAAAGGARADRRVRPRNE